MDVHDILTEKRLHELKHMISEIDVQELQAKIDSGEIFKLIEVSNPEDFQAGHIAGAVNIPLAELKEEVPLKYKKFQQLVVYCQKSRSSVGMVAARILQDLGFTNVLLLKGGKEAWEDAGLPLEGRENEAAAS